MLALVKMIVLMVASFSLLRQASGEHIDSASLSGMDLLNPSTPTFEHGSLRLHDSGQVKRQTELRRELQAIFAYNCHYGGFTRKTFKWDATYTFSDANLVIRGLYNIDKIIDITVNEETQQFFAFWEHSYCIESMNWSCSYIIRAHVNGRVVYNGISMFLTVYSSNADERPSVHEHCVIHGPHPAHTCPSIVSPMGNHACLIEHISVTTLA